MVTLLGPELHMYQKDETKRLKLIGFRQVSSLVVYFFLVCRHGLSVDSRGSRATLSHAELTLDTVERRGPYGPGICRPLVVFP